jgi:hypothetical protein
MGSQRGKQHLLQRRSDCWSDLWTGSVTVAASMELKEDSVAEAICKMVQ